MDCKGELPFLNVFELCQLPTSSLETMIDIRSLVALLDYHLLIGLKRSLRGKITLIMD